jgi:hypothetical protein
MKIQSTAITAALLVGAIGVFAAEPPAPAPAPQATTQQTATATAAPAAPTTHTLTTTEDTVKAARSLGLAPKVHGGKLMWCKSEAALGTNIATWTCVNDAYVAQAVKRSTNDQIAVDQMMRNSLTQPVPKSP